LKWHFLSGGLLALKLLKLTCMATLLHALSGCTSLSYYAQAISGQTSLLLQRQPIEKVLRRDDLTPDVRQKLRLTQVTREFASASGLQPGDAYTTFVETHRPYVVYNVFAAPEFSVEMKQFCFPVVGCTTYKGFFNKAAADQEAASLAAQGYDVYVGGVAAYSTLGWFSDPVLDSFLNRSDVQLASLIFHELAHRELYVADDTQFNESFATAVERHLLGRWLDESNRKTELGEFDAARSRRDQVLVLVRRARLELAEVYGNTTPDHDRRQRKQEVIASLRANYHALRSGWLGHNDFKMWMESDINNAKLGTLSTYNDWVDSFDIMLRQAGDDLPLFLQQVRSLSQQPRDSRDLYLQSLID
jgi:predicted aminopeptidase